MSKPIHAPSCPRVQVWDHGEFEAPCTCGEIRVSRVYDITKKCEAVVRVRAGDGGGTRPCRARAVNKTLYCRDHQPKANP